MFSLVLSSRPLQPGLPRAFKMAVPRELSISLKSRESSARSAGNFLSGRSLRKMARMSFQLYGAETAQMRAEATDGNVRAATCRRAVSCGFTNHSIVTGELVCWRGEEN